MTQAFIWDPAFIRTQALKPQFIRDPAIIRDPAFNRSFMATNYARPGYYLDGWPSTGGWNISVCNSHRGQLSLLGRVIIINGNGGHGVLADYRRACGWSGLAWSRGPLSPGAMLYSSCEPCELSQWLAMMIALYKNTVTGITTIIKMTPFNKSSQL